MGSWPLTISRAISMVMINGIAAIRERKPIIINMEQKNSAKVARRSDNIEPIPIGSGKLKSPVINFPIFGIPCVSINTPTTILNNNNAMFMKSP